MHLDKAIYPFSSKTPPQCLHISQCAHYLRGSVDPPGSTAREVRAWVHAGTSQNQRVVMPKEAGTGRVAQRLAGIHSLNPVSSSRLPQPKDKASTSQRIQPGMCHTSSVCSLPGDALPQPQSMGCHTAKPAGPEVSQGLAGPSALWGWGQRGKPADSNLLGDLARQFIIKNALHSKTK